MERALGRLEATGSDVPDGRSSRRWTSSSASVSVWWHAVEQRFAGERRLVPAPVVTGAST
jgi:hypothetical protein